MLRTYIDQYLLSIFPEVTDWMAEVYAAINTLQERVLTAQNNMKRGLANIAAWGDKPLHNRKENPDKMELLAVAERHPRFVRRYFLYIITAVNVFSLTTYL